MAKGSVIYLAIDLEILDEIAFYTNLTVEFEVISDFLARLA